MIVKINNAEVTIKGNPTLERNVKEELDTGQIVVESTRSKRYEMYAKVDITDPYLNEEQYLIQADNPVQLNANDYQHNLTLIENIAFFNTIYTADRSFKVIGQTLEDILTAYKRELTSYHNISISWSTIPQAVLDEVIPIKEFAGLNFSSILLSLFRKIWAVPKVNRIGEVWDIYPLYHNAKNNNIPEEAISNISQQNNVDYATQVKSQLKNAVNERAVTEVSYFPSENGYVLPRSSSLEKITSKLRYELDSEIVGLLEVKAVDVDYNVIYGNGDPTVTRLNQTVDITSQVVQEEAWDLLPTITSTNLETIMASNNTKNNVRYQVGQSYITNLFEAGTDKIIFSNDTTYLLNALSRALYVLEGLSGTDFIGITSPTQVTGTDETKLRFKYVKRRNIDLVHNRKTKGDMNQSTTIHQQRDSSVEVNEYKKNLKIYSNRMGNKESSKTKVFTYPDTPYELFDYTDNKTIVTRVQNTYHNKFVYCEYEESENFSNIEAEYALMRRSDPYTINAKAVTTNLVVQEYIEFSEIERTLDTRLTANARRLLLGQFETVTLPYSKVSAGVFKPILASWNTNYAIQMPVESSGDGNLITVHVQFPHQTIAGKTYYDLDTDTYNAYLNPLPYTDSDGRLSNYELYFTPDILFEDAGQYPLILDETLYLASNYTNADIVEPVDLDIAASFAVTFQQSFIADERIYVGNAMARNNYFVQNQATSTALDIYTSTKPYGQYDQSPRSYDTDNTANITYAYSYTNRTISLTPTSDMDYFSIVKDGEILLAINRPVLAGETYVLYINHLSDTVPTATIDIELTATASTSIAVLPKTTQLFKATFTATATSDIASEIGKFNYAFTNEETVTASSSLTSEIGKFNQSANIDLQATASSNISYVSAKNFNAVIEEAVTAAVDMTYGYYPNYTKAIDFTATASMNVVTFADLPIETLAPSITNLSYDGSFHFKVKNNDLDNAYVKWAYQTGSADTTPSLGNVLLANNNETALQSTGSYGGSTVVYFSATAHASDTGKLISQLYSFSIRGNDL